MNDLVSIGLPTYNRPELLEIALESLVRQTHKNIEVIVSDNCSPDQSTEEICRSFMAHDSRIRYFRQKTNIGAGFNFKFVLDNARGKYFMWAADDDERSPECVAEYLRFIGNAGGVFSSYAIRDHLSNYNKPIKIPLLLGELGSRIDLLEFFKRPCPSMVYGLYRTEVARSAIPKRLFDFWDFYFCLKVIREHGLKSFNSQPLYFAGISGKYKLNPFNKRRFNYFPYFAKAFPYAARAGISGVIRHLKFLRWINGLNKILKKGDGVLE